MSEVIGEIYKDQTHSGVDPLLWTLTCTWGVYPGSCCSALFVCTHSDSWLEGGKGNRKPELRPNSPCEEADPSAPCKNRSLHLPKLQASTIWPLAPQRHVGKTLTIVSGDIYSYRAISVSADTIMGAFCQTRGATVDPALQGCSLRPVEWVETNCIVVVWTLTENAPQINHLVAEEHLSL